jgi:hypothetical protein
MKKTLFILFSFFIYTSAFAQIPVEIFGGHERTTLDIMFFKFFKNKEGQNTKWLFFNRNRATLDYRMTKTTFLPQYGFTEALSFNAPKLKGFAPVLVVQLLNRGVFPKLGIQYAHQTKNLTIFTWAVVETLKEPNIDYFLLTRYTPKISEKLNLFTQLELFNGLPSVEKNTFSFVQRLRIGLKIKEWQFGVGADFTESGRGDLVNTQNIGGFIRHEF